MSVRGLRERVSLKIEMNVLFNVQMEVFTGQCEFCMGGFEKYDCNVLTSQLPKIPCWGWLLPLTGPPRILPPVPSLQPI